MQTVEAICNGRCHFKQQSIAVFMKTKSFFNRLFLNNTFFIIILDLIYVSFFPVYLQEKNNIIKYFLFCNYILDSFLCLA